MYMLKYGKLTFTKMSFSFVKSSGREYAFCMHDLHFLQIAHVIITIQSKICHELLTEIE